MIIESLMKTKVIRYSADEEVAFIIFIIAENADSPLAHHAGVQTVPPAQDADHENLVDQ